MFGLTVIWIPLATGPGKGEGRQSDIASTFGKAPILSILACWAFPDLQAAGSAKILYQSCWYSVCQRALLELAAMPQAAVRCPPPRAIRSSLGPRHNTMTYAGGLELSAQRVLLCRERSEMGFLLARRSNLLNAKQ